MNEGLDTRVTFLLLSQRTHSPFRAMLWPGDLLLIRPTSTPICVCVVSALGVALGLHVSSVLCVRGPFLCVAACHATSACLERNTDLHSLAATPATIYVWDGVALAVSRAACTNADRVDD